MPTNAGDVMGSNAWKAFRLTILDRDGWVCQVKGPRCSGHATQVDHVISRADGGRVFDPANCRASCGPCNSHRSAQRTRDKRGRWYMTGEASYDVRL